MQTNFEINIGIKSDVGCLRKNNEDYITYYIPNDPKEVEKNGSLFIVADGVGGAAKGEVASRYAADAVLFEYYNNTTLPPAERLAFAMQKANREIFQHSQENGNFMRMATTMVAALILNNMLIIAHVGDSRLYLLREGKIKQVTRDHSVVAEMVRNGAMTEEEARTSKAKNRLTRSIGGDPEVHVEVSQPIPLNLKDRILICSDGLTRYLDGEELLVAAQEGEVASTAQELVKYARQHGGADNVSVILLEVVQKARARKLKVVLPTTPEKLGWDEAETEYPSQIPVSERRKVPSWGMVVAVILVLAGILLFGGKDKEDQSIDVQATETAQGILAAQLDDGNQNPNTSPMPEIITLRMRTGPGLQYSLICVIYFDDDVSVLAKNETADWLYIQKSQFEGWVETVSLTAIDPNSLERLPVRPIEEIPNEDVKIEAAENPPESPNSGEEVSSETPITSSEVMNWQCIYKTKERDTIGEILRVFGISTEQNIDGGKDPNLKNYYKYYSNCRKNDGLYSCSGEPITYSNPNVINENDWFIVFPYEGDNFDFFDHEYCTLHEGDVLEVPQEGETQE
ncbi:MAG TPA: Stp1/IreP family PP2C-type Ser/Thr phosphatase [Anaerolineaceae bacterium]|nr:Stp1/IreP family PP2C-type Ser/Thr phosphatase [Anaerolineaceae bacterium]